MWAAAGLVATTLVASAARAEEAPADVQEVVVTATRSERPLIEVPASIAVQSVEQLQALGFTYGTDEFRGVTGVFFRRGEGDGDEFAFVSIRGSSGVEGYLAMVDGAPFFGPDEEPLLAQVPYGALERVEIVKGPTSTLYGRGGLYGAVNYITRSPREDATSVSASVGSDDYYRGEGQVSHRFEGGGVLASAAYEDYGGWRQNSRKQVLNLFGKGEADLSPHTTLTASLNYSDRDSRVPNAIPVDRDGRIVDVVGGASTFIGFGEPRNQVEGLIGQLRLTHAVSDTLNLTATVQGRRFEQDLRLNFFDPFGTDLTRNVAGFNGFRARGVQKVLFGEATAEWKFGGHTVIAGVSGEQSRSHSLDTWSGQNGFTPACGFAFYLVEVDYTTGAVLNRNHPCFVVDEPLTRDRFEDTFVGAFVQDEIALGDRWSLTLGLRYDAFKRRAVVASPPSAAQARLEGDADAFSPKAALSYRFDGGQAYFAYGRGFSSNFGPTFEWDAAQYARPANRPSKLDSYELGVKGRLLDGVLQYEAAIFHTEQTNRRQGIPNPAAEVDFTAPGTLIVYGSKYRSRGAELSLTWRPTDATRLTAQYSRLDPEWKDYVVETFSGPVDLSGKTPRGVAKNIVYLAAQHHLTDWLSGQAALEVYDDYAVTEDNRVEAGAYELLTLNVRITPPQAPNLTLDLTVNNALGEDYAFYFGGRTNPTYATPGPPRQIRATVRATF